MREARYRLSLLLGILLYTLACMGKPTNRSLEVTVSAYNSVASQTNSEPTLAAWGDRLKPGMKAVAVSRDLEDEGLIRGTRLRIEGLRGEYVVLDRTASRFKRRVDVYMGADVEKAKAFGVQRLRVHWRE